MMIPRVMTNESEKAIIDITGSVIISRAYIISGMTEKNVISIWMIK